MVFKKICLIAFLASLIPTFCLAQADVIEMEDGFWQEVSILGGLFIDKTNHPNITGSYVAGAREHFGVEFEATTSFLSHGTVTSFTANIKMPFKTENGGFIGYAVGGAGVSRSGVDLGEREVLLLDQGISFDTVSWDFTFDVGFGGSIHLTEGLYWTVDYRFFELLLDKADQTDHYHRVTMGLTSRF